MNYVWIFGYTDTGWSNPLEKSFRILNVLNEYSRLKKNNKKKKLSLSFSTLLLHCKEKLIFLGKYNKATTENLPNKKLRDAED